MSIDYEQRKKLVWARVQKELGYFADPETKKHIDAEAGPVHESEDLEDYEGTVRSFLSFAKAITVSQSFPVQRSNSDIRNGAKRKLYLRPLQKRSYLVNFVINQQLAMKPRKNTTHRRFNWKKICDKWNAQSYDTMTPLVLKATYHRAAADKEVQKTILIKQGKLLMQNLEKTLDEGQINQNTINSLRIFLEMPQGNMPSLFQRRYLDFLKLMRDALESISRDQGTHQTPGTGITKFV